jgi:acetoin utilization deacetylase AcuC-like enzyme
MVHELIKAYKLLQDMTVLNSRLATTEELLSFHSQSYLDFLAMAEDDSEAPKLTEEYGLGID